MSGLSTYGIYTVFFHYPAAHWASLSVWVFMHCTHVCFLCCCLYVFLHRVTECMHGAKHFNFPSFTFSLTCLFSERAAVKSCIEHQIQQVMFFAGYSISHQGSGLGVYFMAFPMQGSKIGNEKPAKDFLIIRKAGGYY